MIEVAVGKGAETTVFVIHATLLTWAYAYVKHALKDTFKEGKDNRVALEEEDPLIFGLGERLPFPGTCPPFCRRQGHHAMLERLVAAGALPSDAGAAQSGDVVGRYK